MEITNFSSVVISLVVGMRIAQIIFHQVGPVSRIDEYQLRGKYQKSIDIKSLKKNWQPEMMLPKLYQDKDLGKFKKYWK
jgi:deoxycytidine triphosphate deaminase